MFVWIAISPSMYNSGNIFFWMLLWYRLSSHQYFVRQTHFQSFYFYCKIRDKKDIQHTIPGLDSKLWAPEIHKEKYSVFQQQKPNCWAPSFLSRKKSQSVWGTAQKYFCISHFHPRILCMLGHTLYKPYTPSDRKQSPWILVRWVILMRLLKAMQIQEPLLGF